ncbi:4Fe-4S binding protein [Megalodesulfovibrio paquesii]
MAAMRRHRSPRGLALLRRLTQGVTLLLFVLTLWLAWPGAFLLRLDPLTAPATMLSGRSLLPVLWPGVVVLASALLAGRFFCGWICPLGTTIDLTDKLTGRFPAAPGARCAAPRRSDHSRPRLNRLNRAVLAAVLTGAALGVSWVFLAAPLALATRLYGLLVTPFLTLSGDALLPLLHLLGKALGWKKLQFLTIALPHYATLWFQALFFLTLLGAGIWLGPRLWCRHVCPAGALLGLLSRRPALSRQVRSTCVGCGKCQARCPMDAIPDDPFATRREDCIACQRCVEVCPVGAVSFSLPDSLSGQKDATASPLSSGRRQFLRLAGLGAGAGASVSMLARLELTTPLAPAGVGELPSPAAIRPPGALPEPAFLARCVRCGLCMTVCPTNTLQPLGTQAGAAGLFSPVLTPRRGPCEPDCARCGQVCPTQALRPLPLPEKQAVKVGTARVRRQRCLAWEENKACLVCDEVCPYDAIELVRQPGLAVAVPVVHEERCAGCGYCEFHCPVRAERAIAVEPAAAVRLEQGSYLEENRARGLDIRLAIHRPPPMPEAGMFGTDPYGHSGTSPAEPAAPAGGAQPFGDLPPGNLPPGFSSPE